MSAPQQTKLRELLAARGHTLRQNAKNKYLAFEVRTDAKSIFSLYTSGKFVSTVREGDAEGLVIEDEVGQLLGEAAPAKLRSGPGSSAEHDPAITTLAGVDETGTGELLGTAILAGALLPRALENPLHELVGHVETKGKRAASGWERLGAELAAMRADGLVLSALPIPNALFDRYSKNALLDLAYVRLVGDLFAGAREVRGDKPLQGVELAVDDYGVGQLLKSAAKVWAASGIRVRIETKADDRYLAARAASVLARATRAREMAGLRADATDGPLGTGNAGHRETLSWLRRRARTSEGWPSFVKTSFRTVTDIDGVEAVTKEPLPRVSDLLDEQSVPDFLAGRLDVGRARIRTTGSTFSQRFELPARGGARRPASLEFLPLICGGLVLDESIPLDVLDELLEREQGLASGWRILLGAESDLDDPFFLSLARAHARGVVHLVPTRHADPAARAAAHAGLRVLAAGRADGLHVVLSS